MFGSGILKKIILLCAILLAIAATAALVLLLQTKDTIYENSLEKPAGLIEPLEAFPVGVNSYTKEISDNPELDIFYTYTVANNPQSKNRWWNQVAAVFSTQTWFQNLASPISRIIVVWPGERKEEIAKNVGDILYWNNVQRDEFLELITASEPAIEEGKFFPGQYVTHRYATPADIAELLLTEFAIEIENRYTKEVVDQVPLEEALIIASLLEREASDFENMREVSGVIWNRLFIDMPLQLDATLQYVKGSNPNEAKWWPIVRPDDKYLESPFNTYQYKGLPPQPIANVSTEAVLAALNPTETECIYYFHGPDAQYYCSITYPEHVQKLRAVYGQGS